MKPFPLLILGLLLTNTKALQAAIGKAIAHIIFSFLKTIKSDQICHSDYSVAFANMKKVKSIKAIKLQQSCRFGTN
jgi:hypothetical protein